MSDASGSASEEEDYMSIEGVVDDLGKLEMSDEESLEPVDNDVLEPRPFKIIKT